MEDGSPIDSLLVELGIFNSAVSKKVSQFQEYLLKVNQKINLVSRSNSAAVVDDLIFDSLSMLKHIRYSDGARLLDIGSGAGFPWIIHKIVVPGLAVVSVDSNRKKIEFQRNAARLLELSGCEFHAERVESVAGLGADYAIAKAFGAVGLIGSLAGPHLKSGGWLILPRIGSESTPTTPAGFILVEKHEYVSTRAGRVSNLHIFRKI